MTVRLRDLLLLALVAAFGGGAVVFFGWFNIGASSGHWPVTNWLIHSAMRQIVAARASDLEPPNLDDPALIRLGAGHFEIGCAQCHGKPGRPRSAVARQMTPPPPELTELISKWRSRELFWIVMHGVKYTGMPAWPSQSRDDEVWAMTAFLERLPELTPEEYTRLAFGDATEPEGEVSAELQPILEGCMRCHGADGLGDRSGAFPRLDIQSGEALRRALVAFAAGRRASGVMQQAAMGLEESEITALADYYARPEPVAGPMRDAADVSPEVLARGEDVARNGIPRRDIGACSGCHGDEAVETRPEFPRLDGQYPSYLRRQLDLFASEAERGGSEYANLMLTAVHDLTEDEIEAVAAWFASRQP